MFAYVVEWGWLKIGSYGVMMALGFLAGYYLVRSELRRLSLPEDLAARITFNAAIWGVIGARLLSILEEPAHLTGNPFKTILLEGGLTWYGGLTAGVLATVYTIWKEKAPYLRVFDAMSPACVIGYGFGRGGCLVSGDGCYGTVTDLPWGMRFPQLQEGPGFHCLQGGAIAPWPHPEGVHVHPTPLYEILGCLIVFGILWAVRKRLGRSGQMFGCFFILTAVPRFLVEFIRLNPRYVGLSLSQWISIGTVLLGAGLLWRAFRDADPAEAVAEAAGGSDSRRRRRRRRK